MPARVTRAASRRNDTNAATQNEPATAIIERKKRQREDTDTSTAVTSKRFKKTPIGGSKKNAVSTIKGEEASIEETDALTKGSRKAKIQQENGVSDSIKEEEEEVIEEQEVEVTVKKTKTRKRKTKEEQLEDMKPLAARTEGLRMFIGAHVSASKGVSVRFLLILLHIQPICCGFFLCI